MSKKIASYIKKSFDNPDETVFSELALEVFSHQYNTIPLYKKFCDRRGITPGIISSWRDIPAIATEGFKLLDLFCKPKQHARRIFSTSGTTSGEKKGNAFFSEEGLQLMNTAIIENARHYFVPDNKRLRFFIIAPSPENAPQMIMAYGMDVLKNIFGLPGSRFLIEKGRFSPHRLEQELRKSEDEGIPVAIVGASLGFLTFFDYCGERDIKFKLPPGSRTMDAGGYKGRQKVIAKDDFLALVLRFLGIEKHFCINLLGMTELGSQFYDNTLRNYCNYSAYTRHKENPPWTRTLVIDPHTLREVPTGKKGMLCHIDLTNVERIAAIQTDDIGRRYENGFEILGRAHGALARGCSLSIEEITDKK